MNRLNQLNSHFLSSPRSLIKTTINPSTHVALVQLNPTAKLTTLTRELRIELSLELEDLEKNEEVNVVVLTGKGSSFGVGGNIKELAEYT